MYMNVAIRFKVHQNEMHVCLSDMTVVASPVAKPLLQPSKRYVDALALVVNLKSCRRHHSCVVRSRLQINTHAKMASLLCGLDLGRISLVISELEIQSLLRHIYITIFCQSSGTSASL